GTRVAVHGKDATCGPLAGCSPARVLSPPLARACLRSRAPLSEFALVRESAAEPEGGSLGGVCGGTGVGLFDHGDRARCECCSACGRADAACAGVGGVDFAVDQALPFECAEDLRGHLDVGARLHGDRGLLGWIAVLVEPPGAGE